MTRRFPTKHEAAAQGFLDKSGLRAERLKPGPATPYLRYWQGQGFVTAYDRAQCLPMRPWRAATPGQLQAMGEGRARAEQARIDQALARQQEDYEERERDWRDLQDEVAACAAGWLAQGPLFLDTETTGLESLDQVIEVAVLDAGGAVLLETLVRPTVPVHPGAAAVHGISDEQLAGAPPWPDTLPRLQALLAGRLVVAHHAEFDRRLLAQTSQAHGLPVLIGVAEWGCTLELLTASNDGRWPSLGRALDIAGARRGGGHRAAPDADACRRVVVALAARHQPAAIAYEAALTQADVGGAPAPGPGAAQLHDAAVGAAAAAGAHIACGAPEFTG